MGREVEHFPSARHVRLASSSCYLCRVHHVHNQSWYLDWVLECVFLWKANMNYLCHLVWSGLDMVLEWWTAMREGVREKEQLLHGDKLDIEVVYWLCVHYSSVCSHKWPKKHEEDKEVLPDTAVVYASISKMCCVMILLDYNAQVTNDTSILQGI